MTYSAESNQLGLPKDHFWMVYGIGQREPTAKHLTREIAFAEARRLAQMSPGIAFVVLQAIGACVKREVDTVIYGDKDRIPF